MNTSVVFFTKQNLMETLKIFIYLFYSSLFKILIVYTNLKLYDVQ